MHNLHMIKLKNMKIDFSFTFSNQGKGKAICDSLL
jgi:hypothetical protein